ncbi:MAG: molybdopterin-dependent oxidoreductase [Rhodobacteraceae bacterium]|nr:molybdopterin-dependent oxidoreductase [Paracoccaceae bacterium]
MNAAGAELPCPPLGELEKLPLNCNHWGTYRVEARDGRVQALWPFEHDGDPSAIGAGMVDALDHPLRITAPMVRRGWLESGPGGETELRGSDSFVEIGWDEAERLVASELDRIRTTHGNASIFAGSYGWASAGRFHHAQSQLKRFLNCIGGFTASVNTYSLAAGEVVMPYILGPFYKLLDETTSWKVIARHSETFVAFGGVPARNGQINAGGAMNHCQREGLEAAALNGVRFFNVSPLKADVETEPGAEWITPRPGTDVALMLGIAHTLLVEDLHDRLFLERCSIGFDHFQHYLTGGSDGVVKSADWAESISTVPADVIRNLARRMAGTRTMISVSWSLTRQDHGEQPFWAAVTLAAMLGQIGLPGGGIGFGYGAVNSVGDDFTIVPAASFPQGMNPVRSFIPVARISDMLMHPGREYEYDGKTRRYPDIRLVYWAGGNPFHHHQDLFRLKRAWTRPETVVTHDWVWNSLARHSDIILPCTTSLERNDIAISRSQFLIHTKKAVEPPAGCRNDFEIFRALARRMDVSERFTEGRGEAHWLAWMYEESRRRMRARGVELPDYAKFREQGWIRVPPPDCPRVFLDKFRRDPLENQLSTPSGKIEIHSGKVAGFGYRECPGHAVWQPPAEWLGDTGRAYPLHLISNQPSHKLHSQLDHGRVSRSAKVGGREPVRLHPGDAEPRGISEGDTVRIFNLRGSCLASAVVTESLMRGVIQMSTGAWFDPDESPNLGNVCRHGNPNALTLDKGTSPLAQGPVAHTCLVDIERFDGASPAVTIHTPPHVQRAVEKPSIDRI